MDDASDQRSRWYAVRAVCGSERRAAHRLLARHDLQVLYPYAVRARREPFRSGKWRWVDRIEAYFPGYFFVHCGEGQLGVVRETPAVVEVVSTSDGPGVVPDAVITEIRSSAIGDDYLRGAMVDPLGVCMLLARPRRYVRGDAVLVRSGLRVGEFLGKVLKTVTCDEDVKVLVTALGWRTVLTVPSSDVRMAA